MQRVGVMPCFLGSATAVWWFQQLLAFMQCFMLLNWAPSPEDMIGSENSLVEHGYGFILVHHGNQLCHQVTTVLGVVPAAPVSL